MFHLNQNIILLVLWSLTASNLIAARKRCAWTDLEDTKLHALVNAAKIRESSEPKDFTSDTWKKIKEQFPNCTTYQVRYHWRYSLDPEIDTTPLSHDDLIRLLQIVVANDYGSMISWDSLLELFPRRTNHFLRNAYNSAKQKMARLNYQDIKELGISKWIPDYIEQLEDEKGSSAARRAGKAKSKGKRKKKRARAVESESESESESEPIGIGVATGCGAAEYGASAGFGAGYTHIFNSLVPADLGVDPDDADAFLGVLN